MDITVTPGKLSGTIHAIPSKSQAHRILICAAFADKPTTILCSQTNDDIEATADCLRSLGAHISRTADGYAVSPIVTIPNQATLNCRESGSTLRFFLPIAGALGIDTTFEMHGRLPNRPLSPLWEEMERMGCRLTRPTGNTIRCQGKLNPGTYRINGSVSSQYITGLLFAATLMHGITQIEINGTLESKPYVRMTQEALLLFGIESDNYLIDGSASLISPGRFAVEGDWSNGAFFLAAQITGSPVLVKGLTNESVQGDSVCAQIMNKLQQEQLIIDSMDIPDLVPILAIVAAANKGAIFENIARLRLKESDRIESTLDMLHALGAEAWSEQNTMHVHPALFHGCTIDSMNDHRIAMSAAIAATIASGPVKIIGADCVKKSYPSFWDEFRRLGGNYEQYIW